MAPSDGKIMAAEVADISASPALAEHLESPLLNLPAEIRNEIYSYALLGHVIIISKNHHFKPGLLRTCRQIRHEATTMFYSENNFQVDVEDVEPPQQTLPQLQHWVWTKPGRAECDIVGKFPLARAEFMPWLELMHKGLIHVSALRSDSGSNTKAMNGALKIVKQYKGLSWNRALCQVEGFFQRRYGRSYSRRHI